jgi:hypothetical protein
MNFNKRNSSRSQSKSGVDQSSPEAAAGRTIRNSPCGRENSDEEYSPSQQSVSTPVATLHNNTTPSSPPKLKKRSNGPDGIPDMITISALPEFMVPKIDYEGAISFMEECRGRICGKRQFYEVGAERNKPCRRQ